MKYLILFIFFLTAIKSIAQIDTVSVLFLGNSFTGVNDLPNVFGQLAKKGGNNVYIEENTPGGYTLSGHSQNTVSIQKINSGNWDFVVLQEQSQIPSLIPDRDTLMYPYAIMLDSIIHQSGLCTQTTFFMTWAHKNGDLGLPSGSDSYLAMQQRLRTGYMTIADSINALISPVGMAWKYVRQNYPNINLYASDDYHPAMTGTYLAACTFYAILFGQSPQGNSYDAGLPDSVVQVLQYAADKIVFDSLILWNKGVYNPKPVVDIQDSIISDTVYFSEKNNLADSLFWDFGDGDTSMLMNPMHVYKSNGSYTVKLVGKNECGNDSTFKTINIGAMGMQDKSNQSHVKVYPNPSNGKFVIKTNPKMINPEINIFSVYGNLIETWNIDKSLTTIEIDITHYTAGVYFLGFKEPNGRMKILQIFKL